jgi:hypothetical protein
LRLRFSVRPLTIGNVLLLAFSHFARGCECGPPPPPCEAVGQSPLVFLGSVLTVSGEQLKTAKMRVDQSFKDPLPSEVELFDDGMCDGPDLRVGRQYLMYTYGAPAGAIAARGCTRSRAVESSDEDLQFLKSYLAGKTSTQVSGSVHYRPDEPDDSRLGEQGRTPMKDVSVAIWGAGGSFQAKTDASGRYSIYGVPPGKYELSAALAGYRMNWTMNEFQLAPKGCAVADVLMKVDRRVQGTVRSADGRPVAGALVEMAPIKPNSKRWENPILLAESDERGFYTIDGIPPGDYYLGINIENTPTKDHPYAPTYYPNTRDVKTAVPIAFFTGGSVLSYDLIAPPKLKMVRVRGRISDAAGYPPKDRPQVRIKEPGLYGQIETEALTVDSEGRFEIDLCQGVRYSAFAFSGFPQNTSYSEPTEFTAGASELHFVLDKTPQEFNQLSQKVRGQ